MRIVMRVFGILAALMLTLFAIQMLAAETGEVVTLEVVDDRGASHRTRIWLVEAEGRTWIRGGSQEGGWATRAARHPAVVLERAGETVRFQAVPVRDASEARRINARFRMKYGWRDTVIAWLVADPERNRALILELQPRVGD